MSSINEEKVIAQQASEWLMRRTEGLSAEDSRALEDWLAADERHRVALSRIEGIWSALDLREDSGVGAGVLAKLGRRRRARRRRRIQAAGSVLVLALLLTLSPIFVSRSELTSAIQVAAVPVQKLPDGSIVELNLGAEIELDYSLAVRVVRLLDGEAHFRVEKDPNRPFIVRAGVVDVAAVGTAFTVHRTSEAVEIIVKEGRIAVESSRSAADRNPPEAALIDAGTRVVVSTGEQEGPAPNVRLMTEDEMDERLAWRRSRLEFNATELAQAVALMNRSNRVQIVLAGRSIGRYRITGLFDSDNVEGFVRIVEATFDLESERRNPDQLVLRKR